jgi:hypothetical protein
MPINYNYTIEPNTFEINIFKDGQEEPILHQPYKPGSGYTDEEGSYVLVEPAPWTSEEEANEWAINKVSDLPQE